MATPSTPRDADASLIGVPGDTTDLEPETEVVEPDPPVYDERGNVRPKGLPGAVPMTYAERVRIAKRLAKGAGIVTTAETENTEETP